MSRISDALKEALRDKNQVRVSTLRLMLACLKDREIALRANDGGDDGMPDSEVAAILSRMVKQRGESAAAYEEAARMELAERERQEARIISEFLPKKLTDKEIDAAVRAAIAETSASSIRDMGKVMAALKARYTGRMDFADASARVKAALA
ncbi:GatB/YqeY domain-containing protein [Paralimibaculum aggregatum]|nr:GatB/YqeY domain-containing protein [Limibaculum sp. NKW23]